MSDLLDKTYRALVQETDQSIRAAIREIGLEAQELMVDHISGDQVSWSGGVFQVDVVTGNLRRHVRMEYPYQGSPYAVAIFNNASYAEDIEDGITGEERKKRILFGGSPPKQSARTGRKYKVIPKKDGSLVSFWTVHEDSRLADQEPRPFAQATEEKMEKRAADLMGQVLVRSVK